MIFSPRSSRRAFTLIELLVVISILAILMTLLFPAVQRALDQGKNVQARNAATQLATAITAYNTEYGRFPAVSDSGNANNDATLVNILTGQDETNNPRKIVFLEVPRAKGGNNGADSAGSSFSSGYKDPWGTLFEVRIDTDYDNQVEGPDSSEIRKSVIVWSNGKDKKPDSKDDIKSWE